MSVDISKLGQAVSAVSTKPKTTALAVASVITAGLYVAAAFGLTIPTAAYTLGPIVGSALYKALPTATQATIDGYVDDLEDMAESFPAQAVEFVGSIETEASYPDAEELKNKPKTVSNFNKKS